MPHAARPKIAHLEDNLGDNILLQKTIGEMHDITHFSTLAEIKNANETFDLIITDLGLSDTYGIETLIALRGQYAKIPILALTALGGAFITGDKIKNIMDAGADNVVSKELICDRRMLTLINELLQTK